MRSKKMKYWKISSFILKIMIQKRWGSIWEKGVEKIRKTNFSERLFVAEFRPLLNLLPPPLLVEKLASWNKRKLNVQCTDYHSKWKIYRFWQKVTTIMEIIVQSLNILIDYMHISMELLIILDNFFVQEVS